MTIPDHGDRMQRAQGIEQHGSYLYTLYSVNSVPKDSLARARTTADRARGTDNKRVVMTRADIIRIIIVLAILTPLVVIQTGPGVAPAWMSERWAGVPGTVIATTTWFVIMMVLSAVFARQQMVQRRNDAGVESEGEEGRES
jgi:hypothetical protein